MAAEFEFMFENQKVGFFREPAFPTTGGKYRYEPYRGPGHSALGLKLAETGRAQCHYDAGDERMHFVVCGRPEHGVLELAEFERRPRAAL